MDKIHVVGKALFWAFILFFVAVLMGFGLVFLLGLLSALYQQQYESILPNLLVFGVIALFFCFMGWLAMHSRTESKQIKGRRKGKPRPDGNMSDVAGIPPRQPWLG